MAEDLPSLRAAINSYLRWATMAAEVAQGAEDPLDEINVNPLTEGS
jgi:hypothetical protein